MQTWQILRKIFLGKGNSRMFKPTGDDKKMAKIL